MLRGAPCISMALAPVLVTLSLPSPTMRVCLPITMPAADAEVMVLLPTSFTWSPVALSLAIPATALVVMVALSSVSVSVSGSYEALPSTPAMVVRLPLLASVTSTPATLNTGFSGAITSLLTYAPPTTKHRCDASNMAPAGSVMAQRWRERLSILVIASLRLFISMLALMMVRLVLTKNPSIPHSPSIYILQSRMMTSKLLFPKLIP